MLRGITNSIRGWWRSWRASALLRTAQPRFDETRFDRASPHDAGQPTALDDLEAFLRDVYGPQAALRKIKKLNEADFELVVNVEQQDRVVQVRRVGRKWTNTTRGG